RGPQRRIVMQQHTGGADPDLVGLTGDDHRQQDRRWLRLVLGDPVARVTESLRGRSELDHLVDRTDIEDTQLHRSKDTPTSNRVRNCPPASSQRASHGRRTRRMAVVAVNRATRRPSDYDAVMRSAMFAILLVACGGSKAVDTAPRPAAPPAYATAEPITSPRVFAAGAVSTEDPEFAISFSADGNTAYFDRANAERSKLVILSSAFANGA